MKKIVVLLSSAVFAFVACSPAASDSIVGEWTLASYGDPANPTSAAPEVETSIIFDEDGQVNGTAGCNGFGGDYTAGQDTITFGPLVSTLMFCEGPAGEQETVVFTVFSGNASFVLDGGALTITSADGISAVTLARK